MFLVGLVMHDPALQNSTLLVLTFRNDLENQLFATVARYRDVLGEEPVQAENISDEKVLLDSEVGGILFSAIQKFRPDAGGVFPEKTSQSEHIVMFFLGHRSQHPVLRWALPLAARSWPPLRGSPACLLSTVLFGFAALSHRLCLGQIVIPQPLA